MRLPASVPVPPCSPLGPPLDDETLLFIDSDDETDSLLGKLLLLLTSAILERLDTVHKLVPLSDEVVSCSTVLASNA